MLRTKSIPLAEPIQYGGTSISEIILREPPLDAMIVHGEPYRLARSEEGAIVVIDNADALSAYVDVCLVNVSRDAIQEIGVEKSLEVRDAIAGFFRPAASPAPAADQAAGSPTSRESSSPNAG